MSDSVSAFLSMCQCGDTSENNQKGFSKFSMYPRT